MSRPPLAESDVERIRRERYAPRVTQWDYLHLAELRDALAGAFASLPRDDGPALDLYCGAQPYRELIPRGAVVGVDIDRHFARADVVADLPLPFASGAFSLAVCTQALHLVRDPAAAVAELRRVVRPGGHVVVTVPRVFRQEIPSERHWAADDLRALFAGWDAAVTGFGTLGGAAVCFWFPATALRAVARRVPAARPLLAPAGLALTGAGALLNLALAPLRRPASWLLVARRPAR